MPDRIFLERTYGSPEAAILQPERQVVVTAYNVDQWLPRLGVQRWALVQLLRRLALDAPQAADGTRRLEITRDDLARRLGIDWPGTIGEWLKSESIPGRRGWRRIDPKDEASQALALFIPRLRYTYERGGDEKTRRTGLALYIRMDEPLTPEDEARLPEVAMALLQERMEQAALKESVQRTGVKSEDPISRPDDVKSGNPISRQHVKSGNSSSQPTEKSDFPLSQSVKSENPTGTLTNELDILNEIEELFQSLDISLVDGRKIRGRLTPIVKAAEELLSDYHSTHMLYKVLIALYRANRLDLFGQALNAAVEVGEVDAAANLGAVFVSEIKRLGRAENVGVGLTVEPIRLAEKLDESEEGQGSDTEPLGVRSEPGRGLPSIPEFQVEGCPNSRKLWDSALKDLALQMTRATFDTWLRGTWIVAYEPAPAGGEERECFVVQAASAYAVDWLTHRLAPTIVKTLSRLVGRPVQVEFTSAG